MKNNTEIIWSFSDCYRQKPGGQDPTFGSGKQCEDYLTTSGRFRQSLAGVARLGILESSVEIIRLLPNRIGRAWRAWIGFKS